MALTPDEAMARAAAVLAKAEDHAGLDRDAAEALVAVADGWRRIAQTIHHQALAEQNPRPRPVPRPGPRPQPPKGR